MYSDVVLGLDHGAFEEALEIAKENNGFSLDTEMRAEDWKGLVAEYKAIVADQWKKPFPQDVNDQLRSEEHTSELQSLMRISYAVFCLKNKNKNTIRHDNYQHTNA